MLPKILLRTGWRYTGPDDDEWREYLAKIGNYADRLDHQFLSSLCYEHGHRFNSYFPGFKLSRHKVQRRRVAAAEVRDLVRYDWGEPVDFYGLQFDQQRFKTKPFPNVGHMIEHGTWSFPPVVIDNATGFAQSLTGFKPGRLGQPWHLVEGCHRVSYLNRMLELGVVSPSSEHEIFWLCA